MNKKYHLVIQHDVSDILTIDLFSPEVGRQIGDSGQILSKQDAEDEEELSEQREMHGEIFIPEQSFRSFKDAYDFLKAADAEIVSESSLLVY